MKKTFLFSLILLVCVNAFAQTTSQQTSNTPTTYTRPNAEERFKKYVNSAIGPTSFIGPIFSSTFRQIRNRPEEWEKTSTGFARRFGNSVGRNIIKQTVTYGLDETLKLDSNYYKSQKKDFKSKLSNAFLSTFTARTPSGKRVVGAPKIIGTYSAAIIANETWMPKRFDYKDGLRDGTVNLGTNVLVNLFKELFLNR